MNEEERAAGRALQNTAYSGDLGNRPCATACGEHCAHSAVIPSHPLRGCPGTRCPSQWHAAGRVASATFRRHRLPVVRRRDPRPLGAARGPLLRDGVPAEWDTVGRHAVYRDGDGSRPHCSCVQRIWQCPDRRHLASRTSSDLHAHNNLRDANGRFLHDRHLDDHATYCDHASLDRFTRL